MTNTAKKRAAQRPADEADVNLWSEYDIEAKTSLVDRALRTLKHGQAFAVLDSHGNMGTVPDTAEGLFYRDTRFLSHYELRIEGMRPLLLSSIAHEDKAALSVDLTNPDIDLGENDRLPRDTIFLQRTKFLWEAVCYERIRIRNYGQVARRLRLDFLFNADFHDLFEVRGTSRSRRGPGPTLVCGADRTEFHYEGLDGIKRHTILRFTPQPRRLTPRRATLDLTLQPNEQKSIFVTVSCEESERAGLREFFIAYRDTRRARRASTDGVATVTSSNELFNEVVSRATSDVYTLITHTDLGPYPYAGIPWFNTVFGRDGIITAMLTLWTDPRIARGVLQMLAATQATGFDPKRDSQPGKILHELRYGEMANLGEVPFGRYYGTVDATPLFLMLAGMYFERTGDRDTIAAIWPNIEAALAWIEAYGDPDGDGFYEYHRETESGLINQGWKDSWDAIFHVDAALARGPIALCEVQGYVYAAKHCVALIAEELGYEGLVAKLKGEAERLRARFERSFWCEEVGTYALALDGEKKRCVVRSSNAGHALFTGIASPERARRVAATLMSPEGFSGWGVRTVAQGEPRYNPMSYHNGSVWPHDNAMIALGFARYGLKAEAARVFEGLFSAATQQELRRLPELFCGFIRRKHRGPTAYPVACSPQAWAASATFGMLAACLGLELDRGEDEIRLRDPFMPEFLDEISINGIRLGGSRVDLRLQRYDSDVAVNVVRRDGPAKILVLK